MLTEDGEYQRQTPQGSPAERRQEEIIAHLSSGQIQTFSTSFPEGSWKRRLCTCNPVWTATLR